jgi:tetratricopeptide (TPR) repeat protein
VQLVRTAAGNTNIITNADNCIRYLYEREQYELARTFTSTALEIFSDVQSLAYASATDLRGLIDLDTNHPDQALDSFQSALAIRETELGPNDAFIASSLNNLALAFTELPDLDKAMDFHQRAIKIRLRNNSDRIGNSYSNLAVLLLRMGKADEAEKTLMSCPSLQGCTDETFLDADNPRFVGDMVLLSRIRHAQARHDDALRLASKALAWRQKVHGDRYKTCDSLYDVASLLHLQGHSPSTT